MNRPVGEALPSEPRHPRVHSRSIQGEQHAPLKARPTLAEDRRQRGCEQEVRAEAEAEGGRDHPLPRT